MPAELAILLCGHLHGEVKAVCSSEDWAHPDVSIRTFPETCRGRPFQLPPLEKILPGHENFDRVHIVGGPGVRGARSESPWAREHLRIQEIAPCFSLLAPQSLIQAHIAQGAYVMTPGWVGSWPDQIRAWGFDRSAAQAFFGETASRLVLLDTGIDGQSASHAAELAEFLSLPLDTVPVGLDFLRLFLERIVLEWRVETERRGCRESLARTERQAADLGMALHLVGRLSGNRSEHEVIEGILRLFEAVFAPGDLLYLPFKSGLPGPVQWIGAAPGDPAARRNRMMRLEGDHAWTESGQGFLVRISHGGETLGVVMADRIAFPGYLEHYLNLALGLSGICGLAVTNARSYRELLQASKLETFATLAGGIAHDFNNLLAVILGTLGLLADATDRDEQLRILKRGESAVLGAKDLTSKFIVMATTREPRRFPMQVGPLVYDIVTRALGGTEIRCHFVLPGHELWVEVDEEQMTHVITNLVENAVQAMPGGGNLHVAVEEASAPKGSGSGATGGRQGNSARISIRDEGVGISREALPRVFDPYYSTRDRGAKKGMGLGLTTALSIARSHGGHIDIESTPGAGTTVSVYLPVSRHLPHTAH